MKITNEMLAILQKSNQLDQLDRDHATQELIDRLNVVCNDISKAIDRLGGLLQIVDRSTLLRANIVPPLIHLARDFSNVKEMADDKISTAIDT